MAGIADAHDPRATAALRRSGGSTAPDGSASAGLDLVLEPINGRDMPGYFLSDFSRAALLIQELGLPNLKLQFDIYHRQILHGDVTMALRGR